MARVSKSAQIDVIQTARLPRRCPACGKEHPTASASGLGTAIIRLSCRCGWSAKYELQEPEG